MRQSPARKGLSARKLARLDALLAGEGMLAAAASIQHRPPGAPAPLSVGEEQLWFLSRLAPEDPAYNMPFVLALRGGLDAAVLAAALAALAARHRILLCAYPAVAGRPERTPASAAFTFVDLRSLTTPQAETEAARLARREAVRPFDLERGPLFRATLVALAEGDHRLLFDVHHIVADGTSMAVLFRELPALYHDLSRGVQPSLPEPSLDYADYAFWQRQWLRGEEAAAQRAWWRGRLDGLAAQELPTDRPGRTAPTSRGDFVPLQLDAARAALLRRIGQGERAALFPVLLAAFQAALHRWTGQTDVAVGAPVSGRERPELEELVGFFVNMLVLRTDLTGDPVFRELLGRARDTALDGFAHGDLPFETLVEELRPDRRLSRDPLFRAALVLQPFGLPAVEEGGVSWAAAERLTGTAKFDLELEIREGAEGLQGRLWYAQDLFDPPTAARLARHLIELLGGIADDPDRRLYDLPLSTAAERHQLAVEWADTHRPCPWERGIHQLFADQAARDREATALVFAGERVSYRELARQAGRVARHLAALGIGAEARVGLFAERSPEMVAGILGILAAGAVYVPLDLQYPRERLDWMIEDAGLAAVLTQASLGERLPASVTRHLALEEIVAEDGEAAPPAAAAWAGPDSAAYLMYTSGSTGRPKGVIVTHRNVIRLVRETDFARFGEAEVFLQLAPVSFDAATLEIWGPLLNGGTLVICGPGTPTLEEIGRIVARERVTTLWLTAGLFHQMVDENLASLVGVRQLLAGGDILSPVHVGKAMAGLLETRLINGYGPTENTTFTCCHAIDVPPAGPVPIGRPIANTWVQVVDPALRPVPIGVPGEICAGGEGLARGYHERADLTAERFVPDPFSIAPGARLYRTGDLGRRRPDGTLEFLGRLDNQVKIRGFRIEPSEVEQVLLFHAGVSACAVMAREDRPGEKRLVAYVVADGGLPAPSDNELRAFLDGKLPAPMIPAAFVRLASLPLTPNGKIDRRALPAPAEEAVAQELPRTPVEELLAGIWAEVLGRERVGIGEDFFALGGHSLNMMQVAARVRNVLGVELPLHAFFDAPTVAGLAARLERERGVPELAPLCPGSRPDPLPLSFAQRRLWFLDQLQPGMATYNVPLALDLRGPLDAAVLQAALYQIVRRHEALRTIFPVRDGEPVQVIVIAPTPAPPRVDLTGLPEPLRAAEVGRLATAAARAPFDLAQGPLLRLLLVHLGREEHELVLVLHHIVADGWSVRVLLRELAEFYGEILQGRAARLPELPIQYADYAVWENAHLRGETLDRQLDWWRARLAGVPGLGLATDHPRPPVQSQSGAERVHRALAGLAADLQALARREGATLFAALLASLQALLYRHTGQGEFAVGTPVANRRRSELEELIGFFANTLVLRGKVAGETPFRRLLAAARDEVLTAQEHQETPFERLVEELQPKRDLGRSPLFQVMLTVENEWQPPSPPGLTAGLRTLDAGTAKFDLGFTFLERAGEALVAVEYATALFKPATVDRLLDRWLNLLAGIVKDPAAEVARLPLLATAEIHQLLVDWNDSLPPKAAAGSIHGLFEEQAERTPDAIALVCGDTALTYAGLDRRANRLARRLRRLGARPEERIGLLMRRSADLVVALLGILKSGAAYAPLDPAYPARRVALMLEDADPAVVVTKSGLLTTLPAGRFATLCLDQEGERLEQESGERPDDVRVAPESLAYLIYTSGSTGRPKGVAITHGNAVALLRWAREVFPPESLAGVLAGTSVCFDLSVFEIFVPLAWGGKVFLVENALALAALPQAGEVTLVNTVPSAMAELMRLDAVPPSVNTVNLAGEPLQNALVQQVYARGVRRVYNLYGPSEDTTYSTFRLQRKGANRVPAIGRPLPGTRAYLVDADLGPVPLGSPGELLLGGEGLARGYLHRPDLTAARFVPDPISGVPGARLYRTGDLVRYLPDGHLFFLGRLDHQVKVRGYRIELGEIESSLHEVPGVQQAAVVVRHDEGEPALVAYAAPTSEVPAPDVLRRFLRDRLPEPMVPSVFVRLEALPLTPNGKIDRKALLEQEPAGRANERGDEDPRTPIEEMVAAVWADVLRQDRIGVRDNFFDLGGHSLKATQVVSRLRAGLGVELPMRVLFEAPTISELAARLEGALREPAGGEEPLPPLAPMRRDRPLPLSFSQQRLWFLDRLKPAQPTYNVPALLLWEGDLDVPALERSLAAIVARHESLRTTFGVVDGEPVQVIGPAGSFRLPVADLRGLPSGDREAEAERRAVRLARLPFDLARGPLVRFLLLQVGARDHRLAVVFHHIVADWWSLGVFLRELGDLYNAGEVGAPAPLAPLPVQYADFAVWQRGWLCGERLEAQLAFWRRRLAGVPPLDLPTDRPRPALRASRGASRPFTLPAELSEGLKALARAEGVTRFMVLLAAFQALLGRYSRQSDFAVGTPIANRNQPWIEDLIGFFVNTLVLRAELGGSPGFRELLRRVRDVALAAYAHQDLPFERLVEELAPRRDLSHPPLFQVLLTFQNEVPALALPSRTLRLQGLPLGTAKFDLTLALGEGPDGLEGYFEYDADLFDAATAERLTGHFQKLLASALAAPGTAVEELPLLGEAERDQLLAQGNGARGPEPASCVHERFAEQAARHPEAPALACEEVRLTCRELEQRANRLAHHLIGLGVGPEVRVGLCLERSAEAIVALLAALKAGGAYVPLDPAYPGERLARLVRDAEIAVIVTAAAFLDCLPAGVEAVCLDRDREAIEERSAEAPALRAGLGNLAYVLFTSGSTGHPKAVAVEHRQLAGYVDGVLSRLRLPPGSSYATVSTLSADLGHTALFPALCTGGCLHVISERRVTDPVSFAEYFRRERVDCLKIVPSHLAALQSGPDPAGVLPARRLVLGGEASSPESVEALRALAPDLGILNHYGPTETTVGVLTYEVGGGARGARTVPLGRPLANVRVYVLDRWLQLAPPGVPGELCVGGASLARGYLGRPDLAAERFVPDPFAGAGGRMYRTGDLARFLPEGNLEFLGRTDHQIKVRGFRVEPGEIEAALARQPEVREAVVAPHVGLDGAAELVAYVVPETARPVDVAGLRQRLAGELPPHMVPASFVFLEALPLNANGKVDRRALPAPERARPLGVEEVPASELQRRIAAVWCAVLGAERIGLHDNFFDLGGHSLLLIRVQSRLRQELGREVPVLDLFRFPTVSALAAHLGGGKETARSAVPTRWRAASRDVAIVGMSGRFPGAGSVAELWDKVSRSVESISFFPAPAGAPPGYVGARGVLAGVDLFDPAFFGFRPREAELLDPQHRLFLECCWEALESAGYDPGRYPGAVGVWAGVGKAYYYLHHLHGSTLAEDPEAHFGNDKDFLPTRVSYKLNLRGPSLAVQTSCSSSLVAVHLACRSLEAGECDMALAGGVRIVLPQEAGYLYEEGGIASPDGHCRAFDAEAHGVVPGNGVGVVLLKRLEDALAEGDRVLAVIKGSAINNDGSGKVGYTAPSAEGQERAIRQAHEEAGVPADSIAYVEAHGTATALGDPIEIEALTRAFRASTDRRNFCAIGSLKTNVGHLDAAAGVAGLIKTVLALQHRLLPPSLHFTRPNPGLRLEESPFFVNAAPREWETDGGPRRAGVSSFGIGGTNAHVVVEEAPELVPSGPSRRWQLLTLSARTPAALGEASRRLAAHLRSASPDLADVSYTLHVGRKAFGRRAMAVCGDAGEALAALEGGALAGGEAGTAPSVAFLFPGQGAQHVRMAEDLYRGEPLFRAELDRAAEILRGPLGLDLRGLLFPAAELEEEAAQRLSQTAFTQPALFAVEHALARLWMSWGIRPAAMLGHSVGEYVAACLAGVFSLPDALALAAERGRLIQELPSGAMLAVPLPEERVLPLLGRDLSLAAVNGASACVVSGSEEAIEALRRRLRAEGIEGRPLRVSHAFHSGMMDPVLDRFAAAVARVERRPPSLPWISNVSGGWIRPEEAVDPAYWARHLRATVRFADGVATLAADPEQVLLEVGPGHALSSLVRRHPAAAGRTVVASLPYRDAAGSASRSFLEALGRLWTVGIEPDWAAFHAGERRRRVPLPTYPFERQRYWAEARPPAVSAPAGEAVILLAVPPGGSPATPAGWIARPLAGPLSPELLAAFGPTAPAGATFVLLSPAPPDGPAELPAGAAAEDAPRDETESAILAIWRELFGLEGIGVDDDFLALGGDSLLATQIVSRVRAALGREVTVSAFLEAGTIARLAAACRSLPAAAAADQVGELLAHLESLSTQELEALLAAQAGVGEVNG
ncbi:MAG TPA: amino acid adenylation domain-containing protein [Thermoanaerobaculia bacterium]|nr:amino acid adenylation domain-containing protein [Thermoanaerobaculia bacterium]